MNRFKNQGLYLSGTGRLLSYTTAKLAKEKGFDPEALSIYYDPPKKGVIVGQGAARKYNYYKNKPKDGIERVHNTIQSILQQWLREVHNIEVLISRIPPEAVLASKNSGKNILKNYNCYVWNLNSNPRIVNNGSFQDIYEEALEAGLQEALKLIK